jgi:hypothetical protein
MTLSEPPALDNRAQAIAWLNQHGLRAREHSGWLGEGIAVSRPVHQRPSGTSHEESLILHPAGDAWVLGRNLPGRRGASEQFETLGLAVARVLSYLSPRHE